MGNPPKVLHLVISLDCGGLERLVVDWVNERNVKWPGSTCVFCLDKLGNLANQVEGDAVICLNATRSKFPWDKKVVADLSSACHGVAISEAGSSGNSIDVIHSHNMAAQQYTVLAARKAGVKHVHTQHGANVHNLRLRDRLRSRILCSLTDKVVAVSESVKESMVKNQGITGSRITVIPNGITVQGVGGRGQPSSHECFAVPRRAEVRGQMGIGEDCVVIGSVGRMEYVKGYDRLIEAFASMDYRLRTTDDESNPCDQSCNKHIELLLVGDGSERERLEKQARELGVGDKVIFVGFQEDVGKYYSVMDLFVLPSRSEGLPIALLEAMATGVPVAVTNVGECREIVEDGKAGVLLPDDEGLWPSVIRERLIVDSDIDLKIVERAKVRVREKYSMGKTLEAYEGVYQELCGY